MHTQTLRQRVGQLEDTNTQLERRLAAARTLAPPAPGPASAEDASAPHAGEIGATPQQGAPQASQVSDANKNSVPGPLSSPNKNSSVVSDVRTSPVKSSPPGDVHGSPSKAGASADAERMEALVTKLRLLEQDIAEAVENAALISEKLREDGSEALMHTQVPTHASLSVCLSACVFSFTQVSSRCMPSSGDLVYLSVCLSICLSVSV
jgi:hypothetical protein